MTKTKKYLPATIALLLALLLPVFPVMADWMGGINNAASSSGLPENTIYNVIKTILQWLLRLFTLIAVLMFVVYGLMFITAGSGKASQTAKEGVKYAIVGIFIGLDGHAFFYGFANRID